MPNGDAQGRTRYPAIFTPLKIRGATIRNRLMQTAHARHFSQNGVESDRDLAYFVERAKGGIGLITVGSTLVHPTGSLGNNGLSYSFLPESEAALRRVVDAVHAEGAAIFSQLNHCGPSAFTSVLDGLGLLWGPSEMSWGASGEQCKVMEPEDIAEIVAAFASAAVRVKDAGVDGIEIVMAHNYLLGSFLSPIANRRSDDYGGSLDNRMRFGREVFAAVRERVGPGFALGVRLSLSEEVPGGFTLEDMAAVARRLIADGSVDFITVSTGGGPSMWKSLQTGYSGDGFLVEETAKLKAAVGDLPVFVVGGIDDPAMAEAVLAAGKADMVAMTRGQVADPEFARKALEGRDDEIVHCIRGNQGCIGRIAGGKPMGCTVNPAAGREAVFGIGTLVPAQRPGRWLVVGGGPAGMKAAEGLALRGHHVTLLEREAELGGQANLIVRLPGRASWHWVRTDLERSLARLGVDIERGREATADFVEHFGADGVVVATGASADRSGRSALRPAPPGLESARRFTLWEAIASPRDVGRRVVLMDDEGQHRIAGTAELMLDAGVEVVLVTRFNSLFPHTATTMEMPVVYQRLLGNGLQHHLNSWIGRVDGRRVEIVNLFTQTAIALDEVDSIVLGTTRHPEDALYRSLKGRVANLHRIGDCLAARTVDHAIYEGFVAGRELFDWKERPFFEQQRDARERILLP